MAVKYSANIGIPAYSIEEVSLAAAIGAGAEFAIPLPNFGSPNISWQTIFSGPPASITVLLEASLDGSTWATIDTSTSTAGEIRNIVGTYNFLRINNSAVTGGAGLFLSVIITFSIETVAESGGTGDVVGPVGATDDAIVRFDGATGLLIQDSSVIISDAGRLTVGGVEGAANSITVRPGTGIIFEGAIADGIETILSAGAAGSDVTWTLPTLSGGGYDVVGLPIGTSLTTIPKADGSGGALIDSQITDSGSLITLPGAVRPTALTASRLIVTDVNKDLTSNGAITTNVIPKSASSGASLADSNLSDSGTLITAVVPIQLPESTVGAPGLDVGGSGVNGLFGGTQQVNIAANGAGVASFDANRGGLVVSKNQFIAFGDNNSANLGTAGANFKSDVDYTTIGLYTVGGPTTAFRLHGTQTAAATGFMESGCIEELVTLSTTLGATFTDSVANLLLADAIIQAVVIRVQTAITNTGTAITGLTVGDSATAARFINNYTTLTTAGNKVGLLHMEGSITTDAAGPVQNAAAKVRITHVGADGTTTVTAGKVRLQVYYKRFVASAN